MFSREDWTLFRNLNTIAQKAGVPLQKLRKLVIKELVDNALDESGDAEFGKIGDNTYWVQDNGTGIPLDADGIADLFSINRPLTSSKILRLPTRGALGNGLRVVVGAVMASGGSLVVETRGVAYTLAFNDQTGKSTIASRDASSLTSGTRITITLGNSVPKDDSDLGWAKQAKALKVVEKYTGKSSPWWYDSDSFYELIMAAGDRSVGWLRDQFGINVNIDAASCACSAVSREDADKLLEKLRLASKNVNPKKIGHTGLPHKRTGEIKIEAGRGGFSAHIPYAIEAVAAPINDNVKDDTEETKDEIQVFVNGTPITGNIEIHRHGAAKVAAFGCGLKHYINGVSKRKFRLFVNLTTPYMPITTDGKEPNLLYFLGDLQKVASKATKALKSALKSEFGKIRYIITDNLDDAVDKVSDKGKFRYSLRQLFYAIRPYVQSIPELGDLDYGYFGRVIGEYESTYGELKGMYRDPRGTLYHPHTRETIPIGTVSVEGYARPKWNFNKIIYIEKEGLFEVLKQVGFPEKYDCALLSSKGYASRAVRDVIDLLGETEEEIKFFCVHDADGPGTMIYQTLQEGTTARERRKVKIINLGLDPWEAIAMGLQKEEFERRRGKVPVAEYIGWHEAIDNDDHGGSWWKRWLQTQRVELNSMTSPQFVAWMEAKMEEHNIGKVIPPVEVLQHHVRERVESVVRENLAAKLLREGNLDGLVQEELIKLRPVVEALDVRDTVRAGLRASPKHTWSSPLEGAVEQITASTKE